MHLNREGQDLEVMLMTLIFRAIIILVFICLFAMIYSYMVAETLLDTDEEFREKAILKSDLKKLKLMPDSSMFSIYYNPYLPLKLFKQQTKARYREANGRISPEGKRILKNLKNIKDWSFYRFGRLNCIYDAIYGTEIKLADVVKMIQKNELERFYHLQPTLQRYADDLVAEKIKLVNIETVLDLYGEKALDKLREEQNESIKQVMSILSSINDIRDEILKSLENKSYEKGVEMADLLADPEFKK